MKLHKYQSFLESTKTDIDSICKKYGIKDYTINEDGSIDVDGDVHLSDRRLGILTKLPLKFRNVTNNFFCGYNKLTSLEGAPNSVGGDFACSHNQLTSLEGCPQSVGDCFNCSHNQLTTLEGCPQSIGEYFGCSYNKLVDLKGFPEFWDGWVDYSNNPISDILDKFPKDKVCKAIHWINEYDVIQNGEVIPDRMEEVYYELGLKYLEFYPKVNRDLS